MTRALVTPRGKVLIREAKPADAIPFRELRLGALRDSPTAFKADYKKNLSHPAKHWEDMLSMQPDEATIFLAIQAGNLIGMTGIVRDNSSKTRHSAMIWRVYVKPEWRGLHIAEELIRSCLKWAKVRKIVLAKLGVVSGFSNMPKQVCRSLLAFFMMLMGFGCGDSYTPPTLPTDTWKRDAAPVLTAGARQDGLLDIAVSDPDVLYDQDTGTWHLWYQTGRASSYTSSDNRMVIRHAHSTDAASGWTVDAQPALTLPDDPSAWDANYSETPTVVYDPSAPADRRYKLFYSGASEMHALGFPNYQIGLAISADGLLFTRLPASESPYQRAGLVLRVAEALPDVQNLTGGIVADPEVQLIDGTYHLWFSSFANDAKNNFLAFGISHATSPDGIHWEPSPDNPIPSLRNKDNAGGQQPSVAWNPVLERWEMWFTSDTDKEKMQIPSTFNPSLGFWLATSQDAVTWEVNYSAPRDVYWRPAAQDENNGLLTGAEVVIVQGTRHLFYTGWGSVNVPEGFIVPVRDSRKYAPAVLNLIHATTQADQQ